MPDLEAADSFFRKIDERYPGSKTKRKMLVREEGRTAEQRDPHAWDTRSQIKRVHGQDVEMFHIGALAKAMGKTQGTIRTWFDEGFLPDTPYRLPTREVNGQPRKGKRLFTREMIEVVLAAFDARGLTGAARVEWSLHPDLASEVKAAWTKIQTDLKSNS